MIEAGLVVYVYIILERVNEIFSFSLAVGFFMIIGSVFFLVVPEEDVGETLRDKSGTVLTFMKSKWWAVPIVFVLLFPNKDDLKLIFGGVGIYAVSQNEEVQKLPNNILKSANSFLEKLGEDDAKKPKR